eukprot:3661597-Rhodomonas_salina.1
MLTWNLPGVQVVPVAWKLDDHDDDDDEWCDQHTIEPIDRHIGCTGTPRKRETTPSRILCLIASMIVSSPWTCAVRCRGSVTEGALSSSTDSTIHSKPSRTS